MGYLYRSRGADYGALHPLVKALTTFPLYTIHDAASVIFVSECCRLRTPLVNTWTGWTPLPLLAPTVGLCFTPFTPYYIIMRATVMAGAIFS